MSGCRKQRDSIEQDVVLVHLPERGIFAPSISPFPLKLETFLRMANIPYKVDFKKPFGPKGKTPWMTLNGEDYADSQLCLELLSKKYHKDFSSHLSEEERAIARSIQIMAEEHLYWVLVLWRWVYTKGNSFWQIQMNVSSLFRYLRPLFTRKMKGQAAGQGMGRHSKKDVIEMGMKDLTAISAYLGTKSYFMGDKPTETDCAMFGILAQLVWCMPGSPYESHIRSPEGEFTNLKSYCERMKDRFWPDWNQCVEPVRP